MLKSAAVVHVLSKRTAMKTEGVAAKVREAGVVDSPSTTMSVLAYTSVAVPAMFTRGFWITNDHGDHGGRKE